MKPGRGGAGFIEFTEAGGPVVSLSAALYPART